MHAYLTQSATASTALSPGDAMLPTPFRVIRKRKENAATFTLELESAAGPTAFSFAPGQFNMLYVHGCGEVPISISGDPAKTHRVVHTTRMVGAVTRAMGKLRRGDVLGLRGPFGAGWPVGAAQGRDVVIVAGGIGLAPLRPVLYEIAARRERFKRVVLLYGARTPGELLFTRELPAWRAKHDMRVLVTVDRADEAWRGHVGVVTTLIPHVEFDASSAAALVCGPEIMMRFTVNTLLARGVQKKNISVSMERNMKCAVGFCGHCQYGAEFICKDGPVFPFERIERCFSIREL